MPIRNKARLLAVFIVVGICGGVVFAGALYLSATHRQSESAPAPTIIASGAPPTKLVLKGSDDRASRPLASPNVAPLFEHAGNPDTSAGGGSGEGGSFSAGSGAGGAGQGGSSAGGGPLLGPGDVAQIVPNVPDRLAPTSQGPSEEDKLQQEKLRGQRAAEATRADQACRAKLLARGVLLLASVPCIDIDTMIDKLETGTYSFNSPQSAYVLEPFRLVLTLTTTPGQDVKGAFAGTEGPIIEKQAKFAQNVQATLHGGLDFKVDPPAPQAKTAISSAPIVWEWTVVPLKEGQKTLTVEVDADLVIGADKNHVQLKTLYYPLVIRVGLMHMVLGAFSSIWGISLSAATMIIAVLGIIHYVRSLRPPPARRRKRKSA